MKNMIYTTTAGMLTSKERLTTISNNLANVSTNGFKEDIPFEQAIKFLNEGPYPGKDQPIVGGTALNMQNGLIQVTNRNLDAAINGNGFFVVKGPNDKEIYTRNGAFTLNSERELVTHEGYKVQDKFGNNIKLFGDDVSLSPAGDVVIDGNYFTSLKIVDLPNRDDIEKVGNNFLKMKDPNQNPDDLPNPSLTIGALEKSNVNLMGSMSELINVTRAFDFQKTAADVILKLLRKSFTEVAKPL